MAQRVLIAGAVSCDPDLLIADEPTTALDVTVQAEVLDLLRDLQAELHMGVLLVTHNFGVVADLCDRVTVMRNGLFVETGPVRAHLHGARAPLHAVAAATILDEGEPRGPLLAAPPQPPRHRRSPHHDRRAAPGRRRPRRRVPRQGVPQAKPFQALKGVSIDIQPGETVGLVGESGSGKTTLGRAVLGLAPVTGGKIIYDGQDIGHLARRERRSPSARSRSSSRTRTPR